MCPYTTHHTPPAQAAWASHKLTQHDRTSHSPSAPRAEIHTCRAKGCTNVAGTERAARCTAPRVPASNDAPPAPALGCRRPRAALPPHAGGWFGHSLPALSRHLSCPVSSPLLPSRHQLCRTPSDGQIGLQPCRDPATARAPPPSSPASSSLAAARTHSHKDSCRVTAEGHRATGTIANAHSKRHTHTHWTSPSPEARSAAA